MTLLKFKSTSPFSTVILLCYFKIKVLIHLNFYESVSAVHSKVARGSGEKKGRRKGRISRTWSSTIHANCKVMLIFPQLLKVYLTMELSLCF